MNRANPEWMIDERDGQVPMKQVLIGVVAVVGVVLFILLMWWLRVPL